MNDTALAATNVLPTATELCVHEVVHLVTTASTMDEAHARASHGAPAGTLIIADEQTAGRGRGGNSWQSSSGFGVWLTLIERPTDAAAVDVLSIRLGLAIANAVQEFATESIRVKWPNDLYVANKKLAGILVEARWREGAIDWVAIGVGLNLRVAADDANASALRDGTTRTDALLRMLPAMREATSRVGSLTDAELQHWHDRDYAITKRVTSPIAGIVRGIQKDGALRVDDEAGTVHEIRSGSLILTRQGI